MIDPRARARGSLLGLAIGDAIGTTVEFSTRGSFAPLRDMVGGGPFRLDPGQWTDDTSMALCLGRSLLDRGGFDAVDQMSRYVRWYEKGYLSSTGACFDIGNTCRDALIRFRQSGDAFAGSTDPRTAGNGSLMRLAPVVLYFSDDPQAVISRAADSSRTTHGAPEAVDACRLFAAKLLRALEGADKEEILFGTPASSFTEPLAPAIAAIADGAWRDKTEEEIRGNGYVVDTLEAALWCFARTQTFPQAVLTAANLGDDADTTAAIVGQIAGAFYSEDDIPMPWRIRVHRGPHIAHLADALHFAKDGATAPLPRSYIANPLGVFGGAYPGDPDPAVAADHIKTLLDHGVRGFINLMQADEVDHDGKPFTPYHEIVAEQGAARNIETRVMRLPIRDLGVPTLGEMEIIQATIDEGLRRGDKLYVHCWGGRGRTGTALGIHMIERGLAEPDDFMEAIRHRRVGDEGGGRSPETDSQEAFVRLFVAARPVA